MTAICFSFAFYFLLHFFLLPFISIPAVAGTEFISLLVQINEPKKARPGRRPLRGTLAPRCFGGPAGLAFLARPS